LPRSITPGCARPRLSPRPALLLGNRPVPSELGDPSDKPGDLSDKPAQLLREPSVVPRSGPRPFARPAACSTAPTATTTPATSRASPIDRRRAGQEGGGQHDDSLPGRVVGRAARRRGQGQLRLQRPGGGALTPTAAHSPTCTATTSAASASRRRAAAPAWLSTNATPYR
jgi:hypothetical protein